MKCQILFSGNKKNMISLLSVELAKRVVMVLQSQSSRHQFAIFSKSYEKMRFNIC